MQLRSLKIPHYSSRAMPTLALFHNWMRDLRIRKGILRLLESALHNLNRMQLRNFKILRQSSRTTVQLED